jgi:hypothetical protein
LSGQHHQHVTKAELPIARKKEPNETTSREFSPVEFSGASSYPNEYH